MSSLVVKAKNEQFKKILLKAFAFLATLLVCIFMVSLVANAAVDPINSINDFKTIIGQVVESIGVIAAIVGVLIFGTGFMSHDASQKVNGVTVVAAGLLVAGATFVIDKVVNG